jgi:membrane protease YdiL (CAAX protease family)
LYVAWTAATYLLEGRLLTLLRPEDTVDRLTYTVIANLLIGMVGAIGVVRWLRGQSLIRLDAAGFRGLRHSLGSVAAGLVLGGIIYAVQPSPVWQPGLVIHGFAQVLVVSTAEVLVCWAVVATLSEQLLLRRFGSRVAYTGTALIASGLFGVYHLAHSPPFNTLDMVLLLTAVGLGTSVFFLKSRNVYGTITFHTMLGLYGVTQSLVTTAEPLAAYESPRWPLLGMAAVAILLLIALDTRWLRRTESAEAA